MYLLVGVFDEINQEFCIDMHAHIHIGCISVIIENYYIVFLNNPFCL